MTGDRGGVVGRILSGLKSPNLIVSINTWSIHAHVVFVTSSDLDSKIIEEEICGVVYVERVQTIGIYVNIWLKPLALALLCLPTYLRGRKVWVEHTSMTPCYPINCATARSLVIGERIRRCASIAGADASGRFWVEESAHQLGAIELPNNNHEFQLLGKADHAVGYRFVFKISNQTVAQAVFPEGAGISEPSSPYKRKLDRSDLIAVSEAFRQTAQNAGARNLVFDFEADVISAVMCAYSHLNISALIDKDLEKRDIGGGRQYILRSVVYYLYLLQNADIAISVVPWNQVKVLKYAREKALEISGKDERSLILIFYGNLTVNSQKDAPKTGIFHSLDMLVINNRELFSNFEALILSSRPQKSINFCVPIESKPEKQTDITISDVNDNTLRVAMMFEALPLLIEKFIDSGNFSSLLKWKDELCQRLKFGVNSAEVSRYGQILITLMG